MSLCWVIRRAGKAGKGRSKAREEMEGCRRKKSREIMTGRRTCSHSYRCVLALWPPADQR